MKELVHMAKVILRSWRMVGMLSIILFSSYAVITGLVVPVDSQWSSSTSPNGSESMVGAWGSDHGKRAEKPPFGPVNSMNMSLPTGYQQSFLRPIKFGRNVVSEGKRSPAPTIPRL